MTQHDEAVSSSCCTFTKSQHVFLRIRPAIELLILQDSSNQLSPAASRNSWVSMSSLLTQTLQNVTRTLSIKSLSLPFSSFSLPHHQSKGPPHRGFVACHFQSLLFSSHFTAAVPTTLKLLLCRHLTLHHYSLRCCSSLSTIFTLLPRAIFATQQ